MVVVGITGGIGSGKSTVAALMARRGAIVVDFDQIARQVASPGGAAYQLLVDHFGPGMVGPDGMLDRAAIAARVFSDPGELAALNAITHPAIAVVAGERLAEAEGLGQLVVLDIPLLTEATKRWYGLAGVVVVDTPVEVAVGRLVDQRGLAHADAEARAQAQAGREQRRRLADVIVDNSGSRADLEASVERLWPWLESLATGGGSVDGSAGTTAVGPEPAITGGTRRRSIDGPAEEATDADGPEGKQEYE